MIFGTNATTDEAMIVLKVDIIGETALFRPKTRTLRPTGSSSVTPTISGPPRRCGGSTACWMRCRRLMPLSRRPWTATTACSRTRWARTPPGNAFSANKSEYMVYLGTTENTRYGAIALKERVSAEFTPTGATEPEVEAAAVHGTRYQYDGATTGNTDDNVEIGKVGAFSYATVNDTLRSRKPAARQGERSTRAARSRATPAGTLYSGDMRIDVNFRSQSVFGRVSDLRDKDNNLWKYLDSDVDTIYLPRQNYNNLTQFGGAGNEDGKRGGTGAFQTATVVYSQSQGFSTTTTEQPEDARFAGRFIGPDGAEITGTWSLGQPVEGVADRAKSNDLDVIFGSYGVTRQDSSGPVGPADGTAGGRVKTTAVLPGTVEGTSLGATFAGDSDTAGILRLGKRSTGGGADTNNDFLLTQIFAQPGANRKVTTTNSPTHVSVVVAHIKAQREIYQIYAEQLGGDSTDLDDLANQGRQSAWKSINDFVRDHIFDLPTTPQGAADNIEGFTRSHSGRDTERPFLPAGNVHVPDDADRQAGRRRSARADRCTAGGIRRCVRLRGCAGGSRRRRLRLPACTEQRSGRRRPVPHGYCRSYHCCCCQPCRRNRCQHLQQDLLADEGDLAVDSLHAVRSLVPAGDRLGGACLEFC